MNISDKTRFRLAFAVQLSIYTVLVLLIERSISAGPYPFSSLVLLFLGICFLWGWLGFIEGHFRIVENFFRAARSNDFSQKFVGASYSDKLREEFNSLNAKLQLDSLKYESENNFLRAVIRQAPVAIISYDKKKRITLYNRAASRLFGIPNPTFISELDNSYQDLSSVLESLAPGERCLQKLRHEGVIHSLMFSSSKALLENKEQTLVTIENIGRELMDTEYAAWRNLISVLTHEVMNSVTPVVSLAETCRDILRQEDLLRLPPNELEAEICDVSQAVNTIASRSQGTMEFVANYRKLSKLPSPEKQWIDVNALFVDQARLHSGVFAKHNIHFEFAVEADSIRIFADEKQLEQILINILNNAVDAVSDKDEKNITLMANQRFGKQTIAIEDNGSGMDTDVLEQIFVPFFTTKRHGSGIGMALTRQIMHAHGGQISVRSKLNKGTCVELIF